MSIMPYVGQGLLLLMATSYALSAVYPTLKLFQKMSLIATLSAFGLLIFAHVTSDFSFAHVAQYSHTTKPLLYKISGVWGNHEGSMLLWLTLFYSLGLIATRSQVQALVWLNYTALSICLFMIFACDPFEISAFRVAEGRDLNPLLQDPLLAIHPPLLYAGIVANFFPVFLMISKDQTQRWRFWSVFSWAFMTIGITLGSFWAYYELGWGGWWFWDPVENAALIPWLLQTAAVHSAIRGSVKSALSLNFAAMASCLIGMFIIRSGLVTSVHSFAVDPERGLFLSLVCCVVLIPLAIQVYRRPTTTLSIESQITPIKMGIFLLGYSALVVAFGTIYPIILAWFDILITVGAPYFNMTIIPGFLVILSLMAIDPWRKNIPPSLPAILVGGAGIYGLWMFFNQSNLFILLGFGIGLTLISSMILGLLHRRWTKNKIPMIVGHFAVGLTAIGMSLSIGFEEEKLIALKVNESTSIHGINIHFTELEGQRMDNYMVQKAILTTNSGILIPEKRFYTTQKIIHPETAIQSRGLNHLYITLGDRYDNDSWGFRLSYKPWINLMWAGFALMGIAGLLAVGRRLSVMILILCVFKTTQAIEIHEQLPDPHQEHRAVILGNQFLCPTCNGQPLNESSVEEAELLRAVIRQQIHSGYTDQQITEWFIDRYGERVLVSPLLTLPTYALWFLPWIILFFGLYRQKLAMKKPRQNRG